jgi:hypothetical protein
MYISFLQNAPPAGTFTAADRTNSELSFVNTERFSIEGGTERIIKAFGIACAFVRQPRGFGFRPPAQMGSKAAESRVAARDRMSRIEGVVRSVRMGTFSSVALSL